MFGIAIKWLTIACFELRFGNTTVVTDPCVTQAPNTSLTWEQIEHCDLIALSHCHWDHSLDVPALMKRFDPLLLTGTNTADLMIRWLDCRPPRVLPMENNLELDFGDVSVRALFGRHVDVGCTYSQIADRFHRSAGIQANPEVEYLQVPGSMEFRNFLFTDRHGTKVLFWGSDTDALQLHLVRQLRPDVAILQYTVQDPAILAQMMAESGCKILIPHHMDLKQKKEAYREHLKLLEREFLARVPDGRFLTPENGVWFTV